MGLCRKFELAERQFFESIYGVRHHHAPLPRFVEDVKGVALQFDLLRLNVAVDSQVVPFHTTTTREDNSQKNSYLFRR